MMVRCKLAIGWLLVTARKDRWTREIGFWKEVGRLLIPSHPHHRPSGSHHSIHRTSLTVSPAPHFACNSLHIMILQPIVEASYLAHSQTSSQLSKNQASSRNHASEACFEFESLCCMPWNVGSFVVSKELLKRCGGEAFLGTARASLRRGCLLRLRGGGLRECLSHAVKGDEIVASSRPETSKKGFKSQH